MQKVTFSCSRCSTKIEAAGESADIDYDCPTCGKSLKLRNAAGTPADETCQRSAGRGLSIGVVVTLLIVLVGSFAVAFIVGKGRLSGQAPQADAAGDDFSFLEWDQPSWERRLGSGTWTIVGHDPLKSGDVVALSGSGANVAVAFRDDGRPGSIRIVSRMGDDDLKNCFRAAYDIDPSMAKQFARMLRVDPAVMEVDRRYQLGDTPYAMGAANGNSLWVDYVGTRPTGETPRRLDASSSSAPRP